MLEIGSGTTVHNIASASRYFPTIIQTDFVEDNTHYLKKWHRGDPDCLDWSEFLNLVMQVEGYENDLETAREQLEASIRKSVKKVTKLDLLADPMMPLEDLHPDIAPPYDLIVGILCVENAAPDFEGYVTILKKINKLLRKGGGVVIEGFINGQNHWTVETKDFHYLTISQEEISTALSMAGFINQKFKLHKLLYKDYFFKNDSLYCVVAEKA